jgi:hypothetical protein
VAGAAWIATAAVVYRPQGSVLPIACPFHELTGLDCPGCGSTRALGALARLDLASAFDHNLLVPVALVAVVVSWVLWVRSAWTGRVAPALVRGPTAIIGIGIAVTAFAVVRNVEAGSWLASGLASSP